MAGHRPRPGRLEGFARSVVLIRGGLGARRHRETAERLDTIPDGEERVLVAVGHYVGEGFDDARLDTLFLAMPASWKGTLAQYARRLHRLHPAKREVVVHDYVDREVPILRRMSEKRIQDYRRLSYAVEDGGGLGL